MKLRELLGEAIGEETPAGLEDAGGIGGDADAAPAEDPAPTEEPAPEEKPEEPAEPSTIDELFEANTDKVKTYQPLKTWDAKELKQDTRIVANGKVTRAKAGQWVIRNHDNIKEFRLATQEEFDDQYAPVRPSAKPDAEGFLLVKENGNIEAFQYEGDSLTVKNGKREEVEIEEGQFVCRYTDEKKSGWSLKEVEFNKVYKLKH